MNDIKTVMIFTIKDMVRRKSFIIGTIIILLMIVIGFNVPRIIKTIKKDNIDKMLIVDNDNIFENKLNVLSGNIKDYTILISNNDTLESVKEKINNDEVDTAIFIEDNESEVKLTYIVDNIYFYNDNSLIRDAIISLYKAIKIDKLDLAFEDKILLNKPFSYDIIQSSDEAKGNIMLMMMLSMLLFYAVYFCAYQVSNSITIEKTSKIIETLVTSTSPRNIILGKTLGIGIVGLFQLIAIILTAYISANLFIEKELLNQLLDISTLSVSLGLITLLYFLLGYLFFAFIYALTGSTVSKPEDIQSANGPVSFIALIGFYLAYYVTMNPNAGLSSLASILPISSPFCMPLRIMMGLTSPKEVIISLLVLLIVIILVARIAIKIYSNAILNYGSGFSLKKLLSFYKEDN